MKLAFLPLGFRIQGYSTKGFIIQHVLTPLKIYNRFAITGHDPGDGDCVGACLGLARILNMAGKTCYHVRSEPLPIQYKFMTGFEDTIHVDQWRGQEVDAVIVVDSPDKERVATVLTLFEGLPLIVIDHHLNSEIVSPNSWIDSQRASACEMVVALVEELKYPFDKDSATALYTGIASDTGFFRFPATSPETMRMVARLMEAGAVPQEVYEQTMCNYDVRELRCISHVVSNAEMKKNMIITRISRNKPREYGIKAVNGQFIHETVFRSGKANISAIVREVDEKKCKISLRSKGQTDVSAVAVKYGGGGHKAAAACAMNDTVDGCVKKLLEAFNIV